DPLLCGDVLGRVQERTGPAPLPTPLDDHEDMLQGAWRGVQGVVVRLVTHAVLLSGASPAPWWLARKINAYTCQDAPDTGVHVHDLAQLPHFRPRGQPGEVGSTDGRCRQDEVLPRGGGTARHRRRVHRGAYLGCRGRERCLWDRLRL